MIFAGFLILIFLRPFISSLAQPDINFYHTLLLSGFSVSLIFLKRRQAPALKGLKLPIILFVAALTLSFALNPNKLAGLSELSLYMSGILLFIAGFSLSENEKTKIITTLLYTALIISLLGLYQYLFGFQRLETYLKLNNINDEFVKNFIEKRRIFIPFFGPNMLAGYLIMIIPLGFFKSFRKWPLVPISLAILFTQSIGAFISVLFILIVFPCFQQIPKRKRMLLFSVFFFAITLTLWLRLSDQALFRQPIYSLQIRLQYWSQTLALIQQHPLKGMGFGDFDLPASRHAHNVILELWAKTGILGLSSFLFLCSRIFLSAKKRINSPVTSPTLIPIFSGVAIFFIHNLFDISFFFPETVFIWWLLAGILASISQNNTDLSKPDK